MHVRDRLQSSRFELKYVVSEEKAKAIRESLRIRLYPDTFTQSDGTGYRVNSLYLDSDGLDLCNATVQGHKNRFKLRIRWYEGEESKPYFMEIKRRVNDQILKKRVAIQLEGVSEILGGHLPTRDHLYGDSEMHASLGVLEEFCRLRNSLQASGAVYVRYNREAWIPDEMETARVTFDRELHGSQFAGDFNPSSQSWSCVQPRGTILELKFTDRIPGWMRRLVSDFNLNRESVPKYVSCAAGINRCRSRLMLAHWENS